MSRPSAVLIEADGASRGNPGPASYGVVLRDAATGAVLAQEGTRIGVASNNVAEYSGLVAGLRLATELAPGAAVEVRMDSKLVVEQMSGRWQVKHADMRALAAEARRLAPAGTTYTWVPRESNRDADRLANEALDGTRQGVTYADGPTERAAEPSPPPTEPAAAPAADRPTTLVLMRHGVTEHTSAKRFSSGLGGANPGLSEEGRAQVRATAEWLKPTAPGIEAVVTSPVRRTRESAELLAAVLARPVEEELGFAEMEFGSWDGLTFPEVAAADPDRFTAWLGATDVAPPGGESFEAVEARVLAGLDRLLAAHAGRTVVVVSHVTPIKTLVARALGAPLSAVFRMELAPASVSVLTFRADDGGARPTSSLRLYNACPPGVDAMSIPATTW